MTVWGGLGWGGHGLLSTSHHHTDNYQIVVVDTDLGTIYLPTKLPHSSLDWYQNNSQTILILCTN